MAVGHERSDQDFDRWYRAAWPRVLGAVALVAGDRETAREATAEAFARALERWESVGVMRSPEGWTYIVATNLLRRRFRRLHSERRAIERAMAGVPTTVSDDDTTELWQLVASLPPRERTIIGLKYGAGFSEREIAETLGVAPGTVSATLHHARTRLRAALTDTTEEVSRG